MFVCVYVCLCVYLCYTYTYMGTYADVLSLSGLIHEYMMTYTLFLIRCMQKKYIFSII